MNKHRNSVFDVLCRILFSCFTKKMPAKGRPAKKKRADDDPHPELANTIFATKKRADDEPYVCFELAGNGDEVVSNSDHITLLIQSECRFDVQPPEEITVDIERVRGPITFNDVFAASNTIPIRMKFGQWDLQDEDCRDSDQIGSYLLYLESVDSYKGSKFVFTLWFGT